jgi:hypothetical protein
MLLKQKSFMILLMDHSTAADYDLVSISFLETPNPTTEESLDIIRRSTVNVERILNHSPCVTSHWALEKKCGWWFPFIHNMSSSSILSRSSSSGLL